MSHGFLGYDGSTFMLDFVVTALVLIVPALLASLYLVKVQRNYVAHRNLQLALAGVLLVAVIAFEIDIRAHGGWREIVGSRQKPLSAEQFETAKQTLSVHLVFAISTPLLWEEVGAAVKKKVRLSFESEVVLARVKKHGDLFAPVLTLKQKLAAAAVKL